jgi:hypothetical protein
MALVKRLLTRLMSSSPPVHLGRWSIEYCPTIVETRVKLTNEDHCGTCGNTDTLSNQQENKNTFTFDTYIEVNMMTQFNLSDL